MTTQKLQIGCWLDHGCRTAEEIAIDIVDLAIEFGMAKPDDWDSLCTCQNEDDVEAIDEEMENAIEWLNDNHTLPYCYWANEGEAGAFGLWPSLETARECIAESGFVSSREQEWPDDDYRGEWLHINERGNCVLYVRDDSGTDREIWSVV